MALEIKGKVLKVLAPIEGQSANGKWVKQSFVIETQEQYPKKVCFSAWNDKADVINQLKIGEVVEVSFNIESREFNERWYTDLTIWKIKRESGTQNSRSTTVKTISEQVENFDNADDTENTENETTDDLPF